MAVVPVFTRPPVNVSPVGLLGDSAPAPSLVIEPLETSPVMAVPAVLLMVEARAVEV